MTDRWKRALQDIAGCTSVEQANAIAAEALRPRLPPPKKPKLPCRQCGQRPRGFPRLPTSFFCSEKCREASFQAYNQNLIRQKASRSPQPMSERWRRALQMHEDGMTYAAIGKELNVTSVRARQIVQRAEQRRLLIAKV